MATTTAQRTGASYDLATPTEAEIREALRASREDWPHDNPREPLREAIEGMAMPLTSPAFDALESTDPRTESSDHGSLWADLRPSEARILDRFAKAAIERAFDRCIEVIGDELLAAALAFAQAVPDAPRATPRGAVPV